MPLSDKAGIWCHSYHCYFSAYFEDELHLGGHYQSAVPVRDSPILREFYESGGVDVAAMMNFDREPAVSELESTGDVTCFNPEQNSTRFPIATPAPATLEESCVADTTLSAPYQVQKDGWGLGPCPPPLLNLDTCQHQHQVTGHNHSSAYYPLAPDSQDDESSGQHYHQVTCHHHSPASHPLPAPQDHPGQGQTKGKNKKSYRLKCI